MEVTMTSVKRRIIETTGIQMLVAEQGTVIWARTDVHRQCDGEAKAGRPTGLIGIARRCQ
jgi:hypothetical protein